MECDGIEPLGATLLIMPIGLQPTTGNTLRILKHTIIYDATLDSESRRSKYVLEYLLFLEDMLRLYLNQLFVLMCYRHTFIQLSARLLLIIVCSAVLVTAF